MCTTTSARTSASTWPVRLVSSYLIYYLLVSDRIKMRFTSNTQWPTSEMASCIVQKETCTRNWSGTTGRTARAPACFGAAVSVPRETMEVA